MLGILMLLCALPFLFCADYIEDSPWPEIKNGQRKWILRRDSGKCQFPIVNPETKEIQICGEEDEVGVHHIIAKRGMIQWFPSTDPHNPNLLIILCKYHHLRLHEDIRIGLRNRWKEGEEALQKVFETRDQLVQKGKIYWNTRYDDWFYKVAQQNTRIYLEAHPDDPYPITPAVISDPK